MLADIRGGRGSHSYRGELQVLLRSFPVLSRVLEARAGACRL